jgi:hypothetical protein
MKLQTTLAILRAAQPCPEGWEKFLRHVGPDFPPDQPIEFSTILENNGLQDALWALRAVLPEHEANRDREARLFACDCAEAVLPLFEGKQPNDLRPLEAIRVAREYAQGRATHDQRAAAEDAAWSAARAAAWDAARAAAWAAAWAAAEAAAPAAAWSAARAAAWAAAEAAARAAARAAAEAAAEDAARAAARSAAWSAARDAQRDLFIRYFCTEN